MSAYGPALFFVRKDKSEIAAKEQASLLAAVKKAVKAANVLDDEDKPGKPRIYNYGDYETKGLGIVIYETYLTGEMPDDIREDHEGVVNRELLKVGKVVNDALGKAYKLKAYYVEV